LGVWVWGLGPTPQPPIPNPQSPIIFILLKKLNNIFITKTNKNNILNK